MDYQHNLFMQQDTPPPAQPQTPLQRKICETLNERGQGEMALGYLRYEALRILHPQQFKEIYRRNIAGEHFDTMIDTLIMTTL